MRILCEFRNAGDAANDLAQYLKEHPDLLPEDLRRMTTRPWDRGSPDSSRFWWLVPSSEWPAYRLGKFFFEEDAEDPRTIRLGLYVEKGFGADLAEVLPGGANDPQIMRGRWAWRRVEADAGGRLVGAIEAASKLLEAPIEVRFDASQGLTPGDRLRNHESVSMTWNGETRSFHCADARPESKSFAEFEGFVTPERFSFLLGKFSADPWLWVDLFVNLPLRKKESEPSPFLGADEVWGRFLRQFTRWVG